MIQVIGMVGRKGCIDMLECFECGVYFLTEEGRAEHDKFCIGYRPKEGYRTGRFLHKPTHTKKNRLKVTYCVVCGKETYGGQRCDLCNKILANIRKRKSAGAYTEEQLNQAVRSNKQFKKIRCSPSVPLRSSMAPDILDRKGRVI